MPRAIDVLWPAASLKQKDADAAAFAEVAAGAAKLAETNDHPAWLDEVTNNVDFTERLLREIKADSPPPAEGAETLGVQDWWNAAVEGAKQFATSAAAAATNPAVRAVRPALNEKITYFVGDVFCYLRSREKSRENCPIVKNVGEAIRSAAALRKPADSSKPPTDPLIIIGHSMGGNIAYDYLRRGDFSSARQVGASFTAEKLLFEKIQDPASAAIGGYFLLQASELDRLHDWTKNLSELFEYFPDGAVIRAWHLMRSSPPDFDNACKQLVEAVHRGLPVYTVGLRLLSDGLSLCAAQAVEKKGKVDSDVARSLEIVAPYAAAADWASATTSFYGTQPEKPQQLGR